MKVDFAFQNRSRSIIDSRNYDSVKIGFFDTGSTIRRSHRQSVDYLRYDVRNDDCLASPTKTIQVEILVFADLSADIRYRDFMQMFDRPLISH